MDRLRAHIVTLGCARNEVDSEELAGRLAADGFALADDPADADIVLVNTCGFIDAAKKDSIDTLLAAADLRVPVVAVGCMAERYGPALAAELPELAGVYGFRDYPGLGAKLRQVVEPAVAPPDPPGSPAPPKLFRRRLETGPYAPLKIASGCNRRCAFCAIPGIRGAYSSRPVADVVAEAEWLVGQGVREVMLVSENTSSYGHDLKEPRLLETLLAELGRLAGLDWVRVSYLQPAEVRPSLLDAMAGTENVVPYFDLSFQHASPAVLRRMRRFGDPESFLSLLEQVRTRVPQAGIRTNVIAGFPGETAADIETLKDFLGEARFDIVGVFGYSDEEGTEAHSLPDKVGEEEIAARVDELGSLAALLCEERAEGRIGQAVQVLVEGVEDGEPVGRAAHQGPEADGVAYIGGAAEPGDLLTAVITATDGIDLVVSPR
jgi:ribosomal protein S12 methylthiotransferase RimO